MKNAIELTLGDDENNTHAIILSYYDDYENGVYFEFFTLEELLSEKLHDKIKTKKNIRVRIEGVFTRLLSMQEIK